MFKEIASLPKTKEGYYQLEVLLYKLYKHANSGTQAYLINQLYEVPLSQVSAYLPQLLNISIQREDISSFEAYFYDSALKSHDLALELYWLLQSSLEDSTQFTLPKLEKMVHSLERVIVNGQKLSNDITYQPPHLFPIKLSEIDTDIHLHKRARADYFSEQHKLAYTLIKISGALISESTDFDVTLQAYMQNIDTWIKDTRFWYSQPENSPYTRRLFRGIVLPLKFEEGGYTEQIVRVPYEEAKCFKTKARVPYMMIMETIDIDEEEPNYEKVSGEIHPPSNILMTVALEDDYEFIDKNEIRFEGYKDFIKKCPKTTAVPNFETDSIVEYLDNPWGESFQDRCDRIRFESPFGHYKSWKARSVIVKGHDDLRQEFLAMQIISKCAEIFKRENMKLYLRPYNILIVSHNSGIIECVPNAISLHSIKRRTPNFVGLFEFFQSTWKYNFEEIQKNFVESMAGYSLICYILNLKDRHNGNILLDNLGHIIHIDFGFFLTNSPGGNMNFESAPFKLTKEMIDVMGGYQSEMFLYYKILMYQGIIALRKNYSEIILLLEMMRPGSHLPCFGDPERTIKDFKKRFFLDTSDDDLMNKITDLIEAAAENWKTAQYDNFQRMSNNIL